LVIMLQLALGVASIVHAFLIRKEYLVRRTYARTIRAVGFLSC